MMPLRKIRSMSLASVPEGNSFRLSNTCCMALKKKRKVRDLHSQNHFYQEFQQRRRQEMNHVPVDNESIYQVGIKGEKGER